MSANSKYNFNLPSMFNTEGKESLIHIARVESINDEYDGGRIKASISGIDDGKSGEDIPFAYPLIPKHLNIMPKVGESVLILKTTLGNLDENRLWVGPVISQPQKLTEDPYFFTATSLMDGGIKGPKEAAPSTIAEAKGIYPDKKYIAIQGRDNNDLIFKNNEVVLRNGKHLPDNNLIFNKESISYIKIKNNISIDDNETKGGITTVVADKINLITHKGSKNFNITNQDDLISDDELLNIVTNASPLVFGDKLVELLQLMKEFVSTHTHPYPGMTPVKTQLEEKILNFNLDNILSKNIKIN